MSRILSHHQIQREWKPWDFADKQCETKEDKEKHDLKYKHKEILCVLGLPVSGPESEVGQTVAIGCHEPRETGGDEGPLTCHRNRYGFQPHYTKF
jgi:hypothetical protein